MLPVIFVILTVVRFVLIILFRPVYIAVGGDISFKETIFITAAGLRGSASLIMGQAVVVENKEGPEVNREYVHLWGFPCA
jgi:NhaP-type Na+/H+ and K+/H+ antiporter